MEEDITMAVVEELIREESDGSLSFGNYMLDQKTKKADFPYQGDKYKVKTFNEITKLEKNGALLYESVPGTAVSNFVGDNNGVSFKLEAVDDANVTLDLEPSVEYKIFMDGVEAGRMKTNLGGKLSFSAQLSEGCQSEVKVTKC